MTESPASSAARPAGGRVICATTDEVESYNGTIAGLEIEAVRAGAGVGTTQVLAAIGDRFAFTRSTIGFPMLSRASVPDDLLIVAYIRSAPPGSRWCEIDLEPGAVLLYGSEVGHTARNLPGLDFTFAIADRSQIEAHAEQLGCPIEPPSPGCVHLLADPPRDALVRRHFQRFADAAASGDHPSSVHSDDVLRAMTHAMSEERNVVKVIGDANRIDSRQVVHSCIEYADSIGRIPSISELCLATHVSERRLRTAFTEEFDIPPSRFFRAWALAKAHRRLRHGDAHTDTVTEVATALGFDHLGRFSGQYRSIYSETPSATLKN